MMKRILVAALAVFAIACGGDDSPTGPTEVTGTAPFSITDLVVGTGAEAVNGPISANYSVWLYSDTAPENKGRLIETSPAGTASRFTIGAGSVIRGWDQGIPGMRVGGRRRLVIPPELAYGASANGPIPPNATLLFEIELVSVP